MSFDQTQCYSSVEEETYMTVFLHCFIGITSKDQKPYSTQPYQIWQQANFSYGDNHSKTCARELFEF